MITSATTSTRPLTRHTSMDSCAAPERDAAVAEPERPAPGRLVVLGERQELKGRGPVEARVDITLDPAVRHVATAESHRCRLDVRFAAVVEHDVQPFGPWLHSRDHPGSVLDDDRNADTSLQEIALPILAQVTAQVGQNAGMGDLHVVVVPVSVPIDAEVGQRPALGQIFGHCTARARLSSHCCSIISPLASARGAPQLALPSNTTLA